MKELTKHSFRYLCGFVLLSFLFSSCNDNEDDSDNNPANSGLPQVLTIPASKISQFKALGSGAVVSEGSSEIMGRGLMWSHSPNMTLENAAVVTNQGTNIGVFTSEIDKLSDLELGLDSNTTYFVKAYAENSQGIAYGDELSFTTMENFYMEGEPVMDVDGNTYRTVQYEKEGATWMGENLKVTSYQNGDSIPFISDMAAWEYDSLGAYCYWENDISFVEEYGNLYNYTVVKNSSGVCPVGWHVPSSSEWDQLKQHIAEYSSSTTSTTAQFKEEGIEFWSVSSNSGNNFSGFSARGAGLRAASIFGDFQYIGDATWFWTTTEYDAGLGETGVFMFSIGNSDDPVIYGSGNIQSLGLSLRCVKDE